MLIDRWNKSAAQKATVEPRLRHANQGSVPPPTSVVNPGRNAVDLHPQRTDREPVRARTAAVSRRRSNGASIYFSLRPPYLRVEGSPSTASPPEWQISTADAPSYLFPATPTAGAALPKPRRLVAAGVVRDADRFRRPLWCFCGTRRVPRTSPGTASSPSALHTRCGEGLKDGGIGVGPGRPGPSAVVYRP